LAIPELCGHITYTLNQTYPFLTLDPDDQTLFIETSDVTTRGEYYVQLEAKLPDYPFIDQVELPFKITLIHPCVISTLYPVILKDMQVSIHKTEATFMYFDNARNSYEMTTEEPDFCGER